MIGRPLGPGGYGSFLDNFLKKIMKRKREKSRKKREGKVRRDCRGDAMTGCCESA